MRRAPRATACALAIAALTITAAPAGGAANSKVTVKIGFEPGRGDPYFQGRVRSGRASCVSGRLVRVFRQQNERRILFGSARSDSSGFWRLRMSARMKTAGYLAVVRARPGCRKGSSGPIAVGQRGPGGLGPGGSGR
jgi:hypothetical protein